MSRGAGDQFGKKTNDGLTHGTGADGEHPSYGCGWIRRDLRWV